MSIKKIISKLEKSNLVKVDFKVKTDRDKNIFFEKETEKAFQTVSIPYSKKDFSLFTPNTSIAFKDVQKLWVDLCYEAISRTTNFKVTDKWKSEFYPSHTTVMYGKSKTSNGIIESKFKNLPVEEFYNLPEGVDKINDIEQYLSYLDEYYTQCSKPFFDAIPDIYTLDKITDGLDIYELSLYLTQNGTIKKILLMHLTKNPNKEQYFEEYKNRLLPNKNMPAVAAILSSLEKIKEYFKHHTT